MTKLENTALNNTTMFLAIVIVVLMGFLMYAQNSRQVLVQEETTESIKSASDLDAAQDQLNTVNIEGVDVGLNQLNSEVLTF